MKKVKYEVRNRSSVNNGQSNFVSKFLDSGIAKIILIGISILMLLSVYRSIMQMGQKISLLKQAEQEVRELRLENLELSLEVDEAGTIENLEKEARDRLNYGNEDEVAFVIDDELMELGKEKVQEILNPEEESSSIDIVAQWKEFLFEGY
ncbi:MAG: septum formation initiator family protein [Candidatus Dojkabacteria bacterium]|nr:septum formation initiator family protein [Candidatus Dojkabacteria bacterium]